MTGPVRRVLLAIVAFDLVFLSLPTLVILVASFTPGSIIAFPPQGFSLRW
jgi:putative spermidine/putrescine transport system permease protein